MDTSREISVAITTEELSTMLREPDVVGLSLSAPARTALVTAAPDPLGLPGSWFTCSLAVAHELLAWSEAGVARWSRIRPKKVALFRAARKQVRFGLWKAGAGPALSR